MGRNSPLVPQLLKKIYEQSRASGQHGGLPPLYGFVHEHTRKHEVTHEQTRDIAGAQRGPVVKLAEERELTGEPEVGEMSSPMTISINHTPLKLDT